MRLGLVLLLALALPAAAQPLKPWSGGPTPSLELSDADGKPHRLEDYRGRAVLVNFWATWCEPCREEMPSMERLRVALKDKPFAVLAVNVGESGRTARRFGQKMQLGFPLLLDRETRVARAWSARVLPASFVVGPRGDIRYSYFGAIDWARDDVRQAIEDLLK
ncbi:MAG TPA: TlpA disulfide reductase family protein [Burkholderiales bacterium]|nr:TlpA disulfide reductase family protein [Burkholderiales bacterium]